MICYIFHNTNSVFKAEDVLKQKNIQCEIVPTPVQDKAYCGVCVSTQSRIDEALKGFDYDVVEK